ncbi:MAG TPA: glycosyltransferase family 4 protein [Terriglobia bacterium]|nr:glycosyltransferase family 4 protein [Terriglobia bacterium]
MLKILHLDTGRELRGGQQQILMLARELENRGYYQVIACRAGSFLEARAHQEGIATLGLPLSGIRGLRSIAKLRQMLRSEKFQIIHAHDGRGQTLSWLASAGLPVWRIASRRVTFIPRGRTLHHLKYNRGCHGVIAVSKFIRGLLIRSGISPSKIAVIPDGIYFPVKLPDADERKQIRAGFGLDEADFVIGHAGAFTPEKGQEIALQAFKLLEQRLPQARLVLAGEGPLLETLQEKWRSTKVRFLGYVNNLSPFMNCLDLFIMPSLSEGLGSAALIAMAHGVPVVASRTGGLPEIVVDGKTGWLAEPGSAANLAERIAAVAVDRRLMEKTGLAAREIAQGFTSDIMAARTKDFYQNVVKGDPSR